MRRATLFLATAIVAIVVAGALTVFAAGAPKLSAVPSTVAPGGSVSIDGTGFAAGSSGQLLFDGSASGMPAYKASATGTFSVSFTVSANASNGMHAVAARRTRNNKVVATASLIVAQPSPTPGPTPTKSPSPPPTTSVPPTATSSPTVAPTATPAGVVVIAAGDIASCSSSGDEATGALLDTLAGPILVLGDIAYEAGTTSEFNNCFDPSWGEHKARMKPAPGNHEYSTAGATGYYEYFGSAAGDPAKGYYAFDLGGWRFYALNSNCAAIGGCGAGSVQEMWLRADLAANPRTCVAAYWHHPRFSSGAHGNSTATQALWQALYDFNADLVLVGHDHDYERFAPQTATGVADAARGLREFVVGTGGRSHYPLPGAAVANSQANNTDSYGVLKLTLGANGYSWQFVPEAGKTFNDSGSGACH